ncbi:MAG: hypothetical protein AN484_24720, partial [Aphanizomenon flos-aquae WA102]
HAAVDYAIGRLPECFWDASCSWSFTGTHGLEKAERKWTGGYIGDTIRLRLLFDISRPIGSDEARAWLRSMGDLAPVDDAVAGEVQPIYVARTVSHDDSDPLAKFGVPLAGFRQGLEAVVQVPDDLATKARWARAQGHGAACASHPSADAAISAIGRPSHPGGRAEIRSHMMSAALHLARNEHKEKREPKAEEMHAAICDGIEQHRQAIEENLKAAGRSWGDVAVYTDGDDLLKLCAWACDRIEDDNAKAQDGGGARKVIQRIAAAPKPPDGVVFVSQAEARDIARARVLNFVAAVKEHSELKKDCEVTADGKVIGTAPQHLLTLPTGSGKTHAAIEGIRQLRELGPVGWLIPNLALGDEAAKRIREAAPDLRAVVRRGRERPDPDQPGQLMCHRIEDARIVMEHGLSVGSTLCSTKKKTVEKPAVRMRRADGSWHTLSEEVSTTEAVLCPFHGVCGYTLQAEELAHADVVVMAHAHLYLGVPGDVPKLSAAIVDESAWGGAIGGADAPIAVGLGVLTSPPTLIDGELRHYRTELGKALEKEPDGPVRCEVLSPFVVKAETARALEWANVRKLDAPVTRLTGEALRDKLRKALGGSYGTQAVKRVAGVWKAVEKSAALPDGARSGHMRVYTLDRETGAREVRMSWKEPLAAGWAVLPLFLMDATADVEVLRQVFERVEPSPRYAVSNPHVKVRQVVDRSFSHATLVGPDEDRDPDGRKRQAAQNNADKVLARLISDALERYQEQEVLAVVPKAVELRWRLPDRVLPPWLKLIHHGATVGIDAYGNARAVYVIGRTLPEAGAVERMAGALTGAAVAVEGYRKTPAVIPTTDGDGILTDAMRHPDALAEAIRRQVTEAGLVQAAGRIRAINRTADTPADIHIWCDVPVPDLGAVEPCLWQGPTVDEVMLAKGCWFERAGDAAAAYRDDCRDLGTAQAVEDMRKRSELPKICLKGLYKQNLGSSLLPVRYRLAKPGSGVSHAVFLSATPAAARQFLEARLGPLALFEAEGAAAEPAPAPEPMPAPQPAPPAPVSAGVGYGSGGYGVGAYKGSAGPPDAILTSPHNVSSAPARNVSARAMVPRHLLREASHAILSAGFKRAPAPSWLTGGRR